MNKNALSPVTIAVPSDTMSQWQNILDIIAKLVQVPSALIMHLVAEDIEVFLSSNSANNPYHVGDREHFHNSGLYCETVINTKKKLLIPNALKSEKWKNNPDIKLNMISYLGYPILIPNGEPFGTICVLDNKENSYSKVFEQLIENFRNIIESHLGLLYMNQVLGDEKKQLSDYIAEIKVLRGILPVCSLCKKIRGEDGGWHQIERFVSDRTDAKFSHTFCPECASEWRKTEDIH